MKASSKTLRAPSLSLDYVTYRTSVVISTFDMTLPASTSKTLEMSIESFVHWTNNPKGGLSEVDSVKFMTLK